MTTPRLTREEVAPGPELWDAMRPAWVALLERTAEPSAFLSEAWVATWLECFGEARGTAGLIWRDAEETVGCALVSESPARLGPFRISRCFLNASGGLIFPEHNDLLAIDEHRDVVVDDFVRYVRARPIDELALVGVRERCFDEVLGRWPTSVWNGRRSESPYVDLASVRASEKDYLGHLSSNTRSQVRRSMRLYEERYGPPAVEVARGRDEREAFFRELVELHEEVWRARGETGAFSSESQRFHLRLLERVADPATPGRLSADLVRVRFGERTIGMLYHLVQRGRIHFYQSGFAYEDDRRLKPGLVAHCLSVESCLERGDLEYDFLGGEPASVRYKRSLSTDARTLYWAQLPRPTLKMKALEAVRRGRRWMRSRRSGDDSAASGEADS